MKVEEEEDKSKPFLSNNPNSNPPISSDEKLIRNARKRWDAVQGAHMLPADPKTEIRKGSTLGLKSRSSWELSKNSGSSSNNKNSWDEKSTGSSSKSSWDGNSSGSSSKSSSPEPESEFLKVFAQLRGTSKALA